MPVEIKKGLYTTPSGLNFKIHRISNNNVYFKVAPVIKNQVQSMSILSFKKGLEKGKWKYVEIT